jgi:hypothetical protein
MMKQDEEEMDCLREEEKRKAELEEKDRAQRVQEDEDRKQQLLISLETEEEPPIQTLSPRERKRPKKREHAAKLERLKQQNEEIEGSYGENVGMQEEI